MRSLRPARFVFALLACVAALSAPTTAIAHGMVHQRDLRGDALPTSVDAADVENVGAASATDAYSEHTALHRVPSVRQMTREVVVVPVEHFRPAEERPAVWRVNVPSRATIGEPIPPPGTRAARPRAPPVG